MESLILIAVVLLVGAPFVWSLARARRTMAQNGDALPLLTMLARRGSAREEPKHGEMAQAMRRCVLCSSGEICSQKSAAGLAVPEYCPNAGFIARVCDPHPT